MFPIQCDGVRQVFWRGRVRTGKRAVISYAASNSLIKQIELGAPADIFFSADNIQPGFDLAAAYADECRGRGG